MTSGHEEGARRVATPLRGNAAALAAAVFARLAGARRRFNNNSQAEMDARARQLRILDEFDRISGRARFSGSKRDSFVLELRQRVRVPVLFRSRGSYRAGDQQAGTVYEDVWGEGGLFY